MPDRRLVIGLILLAISARAAAVLVLQSHKVPHSTYEHGEIASNLLAGRGFSVKFLGADGPTSQQAPAYPVLVAGAYALGGVGAPRALLILELGQALLGGVLVGFVVMLASEVAPGRPSTGGPCRLDRGGSPDPGLLGHSRPGGLAGLDPPGRLPGLRLPGGANRSGERFDLGRRMPRIARLERPDPGPGRAGDGLGDRERSGLAAIGPTGRPDWSVGRSWRCPLGCSGMPGSTASSCRSKVHSVMRSGKATAP